jgi:cytochrome c2
MHVWPRPLSTHLTDHRRSHHREHGALRAGWPLSMMGTLLFIMAASACSERSPTTETPSSEITIGEKRWSVSTLRALRPVKTVDVHDPYEQKTISFEAVSATTALDAMLGERWRKDGEVEFQCADGYRASVPSDRFLKHRAWFAFARNDREHFLLNKPVGGQVVPTPLAPIYVIWENLDDSVIRAEADWGWPYQVVGIRTVNAQDVYRAIAPSKNASPLAQRGFREFRRWCTRCHTLNGIGGNIGPELNAPVSVTTWMKPDWLKRWISEPQSVRQGTPMPGLPKDLNDRDATVEAIIAYLEAIAP